MQLLSSWVGTIGQTMLALLKWFHHFTQSWPWALVLLALAARGIPVLLLLIAPGRAARGAYNRECSELRKKYPDSRSAEFQREFGLIVRRHKLSVWTLWSPLLLTLLEAVIRGFVYVGLYAVFTRAPDLRGVPLWWLPDMTALATRPFLGLVGVLLFVLAALNEVLRRIQQESPSRWLALRVLFMTWLCSYFPIGLGFYYLASQAMYLLALIGLAAIFAQLSKRTRPPVDRAPPGTRPLPPEKR